MKSKNHKHVPIFKPLYLRDYAADYGDLYISVCVNPPPDLLNERTKLERDARRWQKKIKSMLSVDVNTATDQHIKDTFDEGERFNTWLEGTFTSGMDNWYIRLWSMDSLKPENLESIKEEFPDLFKWLKVRTDELIGQHSRRDWN